MGVETEYGITATVPAGKRPQSPDEIARELFRPVVDAYASSNIFTPNASRLYLDVGSHPEFATAECDSLSQLLAYERSGDLILDRLAVQAEETLAAQGYPAKVFLFKNNVDSAGNSYGCHENYLVGRDLVLREVGRKLLPFMVTRQLICGAGLVTPEGFLLSQRADQVWEGVSSATTRSRPIINTRDEPHGDSKRFRRMHVIVGDSSMAEPTFALKIGSTLLVLEMIEAGFDLPSIELQEPIVQLRRVARDLTGRVELPLEDGGTISAVGIQRALHDRAGDWLTQRPDEGTPTAELARVHELWGRVLDAIESGNLDAIAHDIDWVIKYQLIERYRDRVGGDWAHPKLAQVDLTYHDIRPGRGLYSVLESHGLVNRWISDDAIAAAADAAPPTTRAALRGTFLRRARELGANVTVDWTRLKVNRPEARVEEFADPFVSADPRAEALLDYMADAAGELTGE
ncbi:Pup--protein ligase [uncultured Corynebacterium sp.]|uniref:Pup--protein ligase n=1 Tax=uncultured Corynebacterium sp. TaxID=159447 RepID=UPI0025DCE9E2|nr:Pup--protein ligase [uncultured Corynebacterium sp.]